MNKRYICDNCINTVPIYDKSFCIYNLGLSIDDINKLTPITNNKINKICYIEDDINNLVAQQYNINIAFNKINTRRKKANDRIRARYNQLRDILRKYNIDINNFNMKSGIMFEYLNNGDLTIDDIIYDLISHDENKQQRKSIILKALKRANIRYHNKMISVTRYIMNNNNDIDAVIKWADRESFLIDNTSYIDLLAKYNDYQIAEEMALQEYIQRPDLQDIDERVRELHDNIFCVSFE